MQKMKDEAKSATAADGGSYIVVTVEVPARRGHTAAGGGHMISVSIEGVNQEAGPWSTRTNFSPCT